MSTLYANLQRVVSSLLSPTDYYAVYTATIVSVNADKTLDINPANPRFAGMSNVPVYPGVAGCVASCVAGQMVLFSFSDGDPGSPYVLGVLGQPDKLDIVTTTSVHIDSAAINLNSGTKGVARNGDQVSVTAPTSTVISGTINVTAGTITLVSPLVIGGHITTASTSVKAGG
jgi:hypothetical protein